MTFNASYNIGIQGIGDNASDTVSFSGTEIVNVSLPIAANEFGYIPIAVPPASVRMLYISTDAAVTMSGYSAGEVALASGYPIIWGPNASFPGWALLGAAAAPQSLRFEAGAAAVILTFKMLIDATP